jgi:hypothetical protein
MYCYAPGGADGCFLFSYAACAMVLDHARMSVLLQMLWLYHAGAATSPAGACRWIQESDKWGGAIELALLSQHYSREIAAYDIQTKRCDLYGQDAGVWCKTLPAVAGTCACNMLWSMSD